MKLSKVCVDGINMIECDDDKLYNWLTGTFNQSMLTTLKIKPISDKELDKIKESLLYCASPKEASTVLQETKRKINKHIWEMFCTTSHKVVWEMEI